MSTLLFPGRHLLNTAFQEAYLLQVLRVPVERLALDGPAPADPLDAVVFAVTSANRDHSRYNPVPFHVRAIAVDRFARRLQATLNIEFHVVGVPHYPPTDRFARNVLEEIEAWTEGAIDLDPHNAAVLCSTPAVAAQYRALGFGVLPAEAAHPEAPRPIDLVQRVADAGSAWTEQPSLRRDLSPATYSVWTDFPEVPTRVIRLYRDPLLTEQGDLTETRDYGSYGSQMSNPAILELKYGDVKEAIVEGRIVDEGCADAALLVPIARDFPDSDLLGIEITGEFLAQCRERQRRGEFGGTFVHVHQRNLMEDIFEPASIDTTICNSTTHELWSYGEGEATLRSYLERKLRQTRPGGRLIIRDVVGPDEGDAEVKLWCAQDDGANAQPLRDDFADDDALEAHLAGLSTAARFLRFAHDFRRAGEAIRFKREDDGFVLAARDAAEFMLSKDYIDNWRSELHETFCFWGFAEWKAALSEVGFSVLENPNAPREGSRVYTNPWIVEHRWRGKVRLSTPEGAPLPWPPTNVVLVAERRPPVQKSSS